MTSVRRLLLAALVAAVAAPALAAPAPPARDLNFKIRNNSSYAVTGLYWASCDGGEWQPLPLSGQYFPDGVLYPGQNVVYPFAPGCVNVLLVTPEGHEFRYGLNIAPSGVYEWAFHDGEIALAAGYDAGYGGYGYVEIFNGDGYLAVQDVYFRPCGGEWDEDYLVEGDRIPNATALSFELAAGCWDAGTRLTNGKTTNWERLDVRPDQTTRLRVPSAM